MLEIILISLILYVIQFWAIPALLNVNNFTYLLSSRDGRVQLSDATKRVIRASENLKESLPIFLTLAILSIIMEKDNTLLASYWLILRIGHFITYSFGIMFLYIRSVIWIGSIVCLILMSITLVN
ncbi:MAG: hypothetical protein CBC47_01295 [Alphaproteobacteria bacterium TMED87]|nr:hypothetical protein [Rhodospirillaceae bacterium]OUV11386.1 MAG: hypothetical protein CBC47_01295 [Alphaproteobacteria bacterium TMED87]